MIKKVVLVLSWVIILTEEIYLNNVFNKIIGDVRYIKLRTFVVLATNRLESNL